MDPQVSQVKDCDRCSYFREIYLRFLWLPKICLHLGFPFLRAFANTASQSNETKLSPMNQENQFNLTEIRGILHKFNAAVVSRHRSVQEHQQMLNQSHYFGRLMISSAVERNGFIFYTSKMFEIAGHLLESPSYLSPFHFPPKLRQQQCLKTLCVCYKICLLII